MLADGALLPAHLRDQRLLHVIGPNTSTRRRTQRSGILVQMLEVTRPTHLHISHTRAKFARASPQRSSRASLANQAGPRERGARAHGALADSGALGVSRTLGLSRRGFVLSGVYDSERARDGQLAVQKLERFAQAHELVRREHGKARGLCQVAIKRVDKFAADKHEPLREVAHFA